MTPLYCRSLLLLGMGIYLVQHPLFAHPPAAIAIYPDNQMAIGALPKAAILSLTPTTYIYGYHNSLVIAVVSNAGKTQVAYSSFESADQGYWTYNGTPASSAATPARTGNQYYALSSGNIQRTDLPSGNYLVSYWASAPATISGTNYALVSHYTGAALNGWTYYQTIFTLSADNSSLTLSGSVNLDELRLHPFQAQMVTTTFEPLVGKTSETDANNVTLYYEYDEFNRLKNVRDQRGYLRKTYQYTYKQ